MCSEERDSAQLERDLINNRFKHLESELETEKSSQTDRSREIRGLEVRFQGQRSCKFGETVSANGLFLQGTTRS